MLREGCAYVRGGGGGGGCTSECACVVLHGLLVEPHVLQKVAQAPHDVQRLEVRQTLERQTDRCSG